MNSVEQSQSNIFPLTSLKTMERSGPEAPIGHHYGPKKLMV